MSTQIQIAPKSGLTVGTTAVTSGTVGRVFFQGTGDVVQQDSALFWDNTNKRLGVGANGNTPTSTLFVRTNLTTANDTFILQNGQYGNPIFRVRDNATTSQSSIGSLFVAARIYGSNSTVTGNELDLGGYGLGTSYGDNANNAVWLNNQGNVGDGEGSTAISVTSNIYFNLQTTKKIKFEGQSGHFGIGNVGTLGARLDVRAQGALSTDIAFRVRNSADTANLFQVNGNNSIYMLGDSDVGSIRLIRQTGHSTALQHRSSATLPSIFTIGTSVSGGSIPQIVFDCQQGDGTYSTFTMQRFISGITDLTGSSLQASFGVNNTVCFTMKNSLNYQSFGSVPTTTPADHFAMYSADIVAGNAAPHFRTENGGIIKLYKETTAVTASTFITNTSGILNDSATFDGYTIGQVVKALRNLGILA